MNITFKLENWFKKTTPRLAQIIGDIALVCTLISANILMLKQYVLQIFPTVNQDYFTKVNAVCILVCASIKVLSKFFGVKFDFNGNDSGVPPNNVTPVNYKGNN